MAVFVDRLRYRRPTAEWRHDSSCRLVADTLEELHEFARKIGLKRGWFQNSAKHPHYDLTAARRKRAVKEGAVEIDDRAMARKMREWRG